MDYFKDFPPQVNFSEMDEASLQSYLESLKAPFARYIQDSYSHASGT